MKNFKEVLQKRLLFMGLFNGLAVIFIVLTGAYYDSIAASGSQNIADMIRGFQVGIFISLQTVLLLYMTKYRKALKDETKLKLLYVEEHDERTKLITDKIGGLGFNFTLASIATATVMAGFFHQTVFITLLLVLIYAVLVKGSLKIYYKNKY